ncbi:MAG: delta-60 repeat domain-containing protein, partial [Tepidisphaeraceae bacterium]
MNYKHTKCRAWGVESLESRLLMAAGALDKSFSSDGKTTIDIGGGVIMDASDVAVQSDGKTVIVGEARASATSQTFKFVVARLNLDGTPDTTFGTSGNGIVQADVGDGSDDSANCVAIQGDGKIVVGGFSEVGGLFGETVKFGVARFNTNGTLDKNFSGDGKRTIDFGFGFARDILIQTVNTANGPVEKILIVGED